MKRFKLIKELGDYQIGDICSFDEDNNIIFDKNSVNVPRIFNPIFCPQIWEDISESIKEGDWIFIKDWRFLERDTEILLPESNVHKIKSIVFDKIHNNTIIFTENNLKHVFYTPSINFYVRLATPEEISESTKDWEIVEFKIVNDGYIFKLKDGYGGCYSLNDMLHKDNCVDNGHFSIHTVKCLSTGETLTVGDDTNMGKIEKFKIGAVNQNNMYVFIQFDDTYELEHVKKVVKKPIFTTLDGVEIFEGMSYAYIDGNKIKEKKSADKYSGKDDLKKYFSTRQTAEQYLIENTSCLSFKDLERYIITVFLQDNIIKIIKDKLNLQ